MTATTVWILLPVVVLAVWAAIAFNALVRLRNQVRAAWADIDVQLMRRHDLVPQLVTAVRAYAGHERQLMEDVTRLRTQAAGIASPARLGEVESELEGLLSRIVILKEDYPDLKANENFAQLQRDLVDVETQLQYARRFYNGAVRDLNDRVQRVPDVLIARATSFREAEFFQAGAESSRAVHVELSP